MQTVAQLQSGALAGTTSLKLCEALEEFPMEIFDLADTLTYLDLSGNRLKELPAELGRLKKLKILFCSDNLFTVLPAVLGECPALEMIGFKANLIATVPAGFMNVNLRWLILTNNRITELPKEIGNCPRMEKLALAGNRLTELPVELSKCRNLSLLRISANRLAELPDWLMTMPRLAWLAFSGNLFSVNNNAIVLPTVGWHELDMHHVLGEGASGIISKGTLQNQASTQDVAVKVFKGAVTSDGLPEDEMNAFIAAGAHAGLVELVAQVDGHPEGKKGLVMGLIDEHFYNLGLPPSLDSCTRDVFKSGMSLTMKQVIKISCTIASIGAQLHSKGIMHGDLYAHNTLIDDEGNTLFGDFGAASFYDLNDDLTAFALERLEVLAFGYLLDDLLSLYSAGRDNAAYNKLQELQGECLLPDVSSRPGFTYLHGELVQLQEGAIADVQ